MRIKRWQTLVTVAALALMLWATGSVRASPPAERGAIQGEVGAAAVVTPLLQYQGRLTDPGSGDPVSDGMYEICFRLYNAESGGSPLWTEIEDVPVQGGLLSTVLGDASALDPALFNGQALWLGIKVGSDAEAIPRQPVLPVAYALSLVPGARMQANSGPVLEVNHTGGGEALRVGGNLDVSGSLLGGSHSHSGLTLETTVLDVPCAGVYSVEEKWEKIVDVGEFNKLDAGSKVQVTYNGRIYTETFRDGAIGTWFELRIDGAPTTHGRARANVRDSEAGLDGVPVSMTGIFTEFGAGAHVVSIWAQVARGTANLVGVDPSCWESDHIVIREWK